MNPIIATRHNDDAMPPEVATAILTEPRARLTNRFRKTAKLAREKVFFSAVPVFRSGEGKLCERVPAPATPASTKLKTATIAQLRKWLPRVIARRLVAQRKAVKLNDLDTSKFTPAKLRARAFAIAVLERQAGALDAARELLEDEIARRMKRPLDFAARTKGFLAIDPAVRRRSILRMCAGAQS